MNVCIPIESDQGEDSPVCAHFGSAPAFLFVDTDSGAMRVKRNEKQDHEHGQCRPLDAVAGEPVNAMIVGGIGRGAFLGLTRAGIQVLLSERRTVKETLEALRAGELGPVDPSALCGGHAAGQGHGLSGGGCGHDRGGSKSPF